MVSGVTRALIRGGGGGEGGSVYSYIRVLPDGFLLKLSSFQMKLVGQNTNICILYTPPPPPINAIGTGHGVNSCKPCSFYAGRVSCRHRVNGV